ncbi:hypothetical protein [uncultured Litoreibacter sp.]|uniref:hypothetical protein n=1 Tax=uncultured Litoreibacter sp. TaxID=1392394 RepID=UPI002617FAD2|nr:hypothetical protein [uncultured Litoreibacter sp.]
MTISLTERARNRRLIALQALQVRKLGADSGVVMITTPAREAAPVFSSSRGAPMNNLFLAA